MCQGPLLASDDFWGCGWSCTAGVLAASSAVHRDCILARSLASCQREDGARYGASPDIDFAVA